jgi:hypothetical protein
LIRPNRGSEALAIARAAHGCFKKERRDWSRAL